MELETARLYIRHLRESDWPQMKTIFTDFSGSEYAVYDMPLPTEDPEVKALTKRFSQSQSFFGVFPKGSGQMLGYVCFHQQEQRYDLGYCFHSAHHAKGYAYESIGALIDHYHKEYGATHFTAGTAMANTPSCKLLAKLGFACVSTQIVSFDNSFSFPGGNFVLTVK